MFRSFSFLLFLLVLFLPTVGGAVSPDSISSPYPAHAHNDYVHERPLYEALENGFRSIEADVFSEGDSLFVAHDRKDIRPGRTLRELYLEPLGKYFSQGRETIYDSTNPLIILIDIKDNGLTTYQLLDRILHAYREMLCQVSPDGYSGGNLMVLVSGNRPIKFISEQSQRFAFVDGRLKDLTTTYPPELMPLISDRWDKYFSWRGHGEMPETERVKLRSYVERAHERGQLIRFWATPDEPGEEREAVWTELLNAKVNLINTDDLCGLRMFLSARGG